MRSKIVRSSIVATTLAVVLNTHVAQAIEITEESDASALAQALFFNLAGDDNISNFTASLDFGIQGGFYGGYGGYGGELSVANEFDGGFYGGGSQAGTFTNDARTYGLPAQGGIVLSTGNVANYGLGFGGYGGSDIFGNVANPEQGALLESVSGFTNGGYGGYGGDGGYGGGSSFFDPVELDISFDSAVDTTYTFFAAFGSNESPGTFFNDAFGIFINDPNDPSSGELINVAGTTPTGGIPGVTPLEPVSLANPDFIQLDNPPTNLFNVLAPNGNPLLRFDIPVVSGENTFKILLSDTGDSIVDTTVYLSGFAELGETAVTPILPAPIDPSNPPVNDEGEIFFEFAEIPVIEGEILWFDPEIATGYSYEFDTQLASVTAPPFNVVGDLDGYELTVNGQTFALGVGETFDFLDPLLTIGDVFSFEINGIDEALMLDPTNTQAFVTGVTFVQSGNVNFTQTPIITFIPDDNGADPVSTPASALLVGLGLAGLGFARRRKLK